MRRFLTLLFAGLALILGSCTTEENTVIVAPIDRSLDPSLTPAVLYTYPPANTVGPFSIFTPSFYGCYFECNPCDCVRPPHFSVQFNKVMFVTSFNDSTIRCLGFDHPVHVKPTASPAGISRVVDFRITEETPYITDVPYQVGKAYTIIIDTGVTDVQGNHLASPYTFSFTPEPYFRLLHSNPAAGDTISSNGIAAVQFNSPIDTSLASKLSFMPPVAGQWSIYPGLDASFRPTRGFQGGTDYRLIVSDAAKDHEGNHVQHQTEVPFHTMGFSVTSPALSSDDTLTLLSAIVPVKFTAAVDGRGLDSLVTITPAGRFNFYGGWDGISIVPELQDFLPETTYQVTLSPNLRSTAGDRLGIPYAFSFRTPRFKVTSLYPKGKNVSRAAILSLTFNGRIDTSTVRSSFTITPAAPGHIEMDRVGARRFSFIPDSIYQAATTYTVTIANTLRSIGGFPLTYDAVFKFSTAP